MISSDSVVRNCVASVSSKSPDIRTSLETRFGETLERVTKSVEQNPDLLVALSGGVDSVVLLSLAVRLKNQDRCNVRAVYVDHGLQAQSGEWGNRCATLLSLIHISEPTRPY